MSEGYIVGTCEEFCPKYETKLRIKEKLLHFYELKNGKKDTPGILVKSFSRSAAGMKSPETCDLRTPQCLQRTVQYLLKDLVLDKRRPFVHVYHFIFDRLRAVRQDIVIQNYDSVMLIKFLEPIVAFLSFSRYTLCEETHDDFNPKICDQHLQECLQRALRCYDEIPVAHWTSKQNANERMKRGFIESIYQIFNLGSMEALRRYIHLNSCIKSEALLEKCSSIAMHYYQGNFYQVVAGLRDLPHVLCALGSLKLPEIRREMYKQFSRAYGSKSLRVPANFLCKVMGYDREEDLLTDCVYYKIDVMSDRKSVRFANNEISTQTPTPKCKQHMFVHNKFMQVYLPDILLLYKL